MKMKRLARHSWVAGASITESASEDGWTRRYTATIRGYENWKIYEGRAIDPEMIIRVVKAIRARIDAEDEAVFSETNQPAIDAASLTAMATRHEGRG